MTMNSLQHADQHAVDDMPDVIRPVSHTACAQCQLTCNRHTSVYDSSSSSSPSPAAAAAGYHVTFASRDNADGAEPAGSQNGLPEPLPDLVNAHGLATSSTYDRPVTYHAATVNHYIPQRPTSMRSTTNRFVRGKK